MVLPSLFIVSSLVLHLILFCVSPSLVSISFYSGQQSCCGVLTADRVLTEGKVGQCVVEIKEVGGEEDMESVGRPSTDRKTEAAPAALWDAILELHRRRTVHKIPRSNTSVLFRPIKGASCLGSPPPITAGRKWARGRIRMARTDKDMVRHGRTG